MRYWIYRLCLLLIFLLPACSTPKKPTEKHLSEQSDATHSQPTQNTLADQTSQINQRALNNRPPENVIYFEFDKSNIRPEARQILQDHAQHLKKYPHIHVRLEGHADERGSREYNLALGEQRAVAAKQVLTIFGVHGDNIETFSYGEEMPINFRHDETAWQLNRRVEIVYPLN